VYQGEPNQDLTETWGRFTTYGKGDKPWSYDLEGRGRLTQWSRIGRRSRLGGEKKKRKNAHRARIARKKGT